MRAHLRADRRFLSLLAASVLGCGAVVGVGAGPAFAAADGPTSLTTAGKACAATAPGPYLSPERLNDAHAVVLGGSYDTSTWGADSTAHFQVWDVTTPDSPQDWSDGVSESSGTIAVQLEDPSRQLDGVTYAWRARITDGTDTSSWSDTCYFTVDRNGGPAPTVASDEYPAGGWDDPHGEVGRPATFTFTAASDDTVAYQYHFYGDTDGGEDKTVQAAGLGGPASITWTPTQTSYNSLTVYAIDRAGNYSDRRDYDFAVRETRPSVFSPVYQGGNQGANLDYNVGVPGEFDFTSNVPDTASFVWHIDADGPSGTTDADADGKATVMIAPTRAGEQTLYVRSVVRDGSTHPEQAYVFFVDNGPKVTGDTDQGVIIGSSLHFHLEPRTAHVTSYVYSGIDMGSHQVGDKVTIPADAKGAADLTWTADNTNRSTIGLNVQAVSSDGTLSTERWLSMNVWGAGPTITRVGGDVVGTTATFTVRTDMANPKEYEAYLNQDQSTKKIIPAAADGTATFTFAITEARYSSITVVARNAAGVETDQGSTSWSVTNGPAVTSTDFPAQSEGQFGPGTFTFKAQQPGATQFAYSINYAEQQTVAVGADGTATVNWTPPGSGYFSLVVNSLTASGTRSNQTSYSFHIAPDPVTVTSVSPTSVAPGDVRTITITGSAFNMGNQVTVTPADGNYTIATVTGVSADRTTLTATVDLTSAVLGQAKVTVQPDPYSDGVALANAFTIANPTLLKPVTPPAITGTAAVASTLRVSTGTWNPAASTYAYQWAANGTAISGATGATYVVPAAQLGKRLTVKVTASKPAYTSATATTAATAAIAKGPAPQATANPKITGTAQVGATLQASTGTWSPAADSYRYQWRVGGTLSTITAKSLTVTTAMRGKAITVTVVAVKAGYNDGSATSAAVNIPK
jgi:hypothetical protein